MRALQLFLSTVLLFGACDEGGATAPPGERAGPVPPPIGSTLRAANVADYPDLINPSLQWLLQHGVELTTGPYRKVELPRPFREATDKYSAQVKLSDDGASIVDHIAGLPFPRIDASDPQVAIKLAYNFESAVARDDLTVRLVECRSGTLGTAGQPFHPERTFLSDRYARLYFRERTTVAPMPAPQANRDAVRYKEVLAPLLEPFTQKGFGMVSFRYLDPARKDDTWRYLPVVRRIGRLSAEQRSDPVFEHEIDPDSFDGFAGKASSFNWKYLGEKTLLATFHDVSIPVTWGAAPGDYVHGGTWEPRRVWMLEGISKLPAYSYSRRVLYIDQETFLIPQSDLYDRSGQLWKIWVSSFLFARAPTPSAAHRFEYDVPFVPSVTMVDVLMGRATVCELPSRGHPQEQGWYVNEAKTGECYYDFNCPYVMGCECRDGEGGFRQGP